MNECNACHLCGLRKFNIYGTRGRGKWKGKTPANSDMRNKIFISWWRQINWKHFGIYLFLHNTTTRHVALSGRWKGALPTRKRETYVFMLIGFQGACLDYFISISWKNCKIWSQAEIRNGTFASVHNCVCVLFAYISFQVEETTWREREFR